MNYNYEETSKKECLATGRLQMFGAIRMVLSGFPVEEAGKRYDIDRDTLKSMCDTIEKERGLSNEAISLVTNK